MPLYNNVTGWQLSRGATLSILSYNKVPVLRSNLMALKNNAPLYSSHFVTTFRGALMPKSVIGVRKKCNISIFCKVCYAFSPNNPIFAVRHFWGKNLLQIYVKEIVFSKS